MTQNLSHALESHVAEQKYHRTHLIDQDVLRTAFAHAMSVMYKDEVPLYGDLVEIVREINQAVITEEMAAAGRTNDHQQPLWDEKKERLDLERHGAIRLGSAYELGVIQRVFALIGLYPVGYYDLSPAGLPMHATAFRPVSQQSLARNPFRVFTTLLRPELLEPRPRELALSMIARRKIFTDELLDHVEQGEAQGGFTPAQVPSFISEALKTFRWQHSATCSLEDYQALKAEHAILADISCFGTAHINHLTPRTLDIDRTYTLMKSRNLKVKDGIEGPPRRSVPVLLRQTSFLALEERVHFGGGGGGGASAAAESTIVQGMHKARFGEIEQRGAALTAKGRALYDGMLAQGDLPDRSCTFNARIPDNWNDLRRLGLVYCLYRVKAHNSSSSSQSESVARGKQVSATQLLDAGILEAIPQTYEDFLPLSAAGIFRSNLSDTDSTGGTSSTSSTSSNPNASDASSGTVGTDTNHVEQEPPQSSSHQYWSFPDQDGLEVALGRRVMDPYEWYGRAQEDSLKMCSDVLGMVISDRVMT